MLFIYSSAGSRISQFPNSDQFSGVFFKEPFLVFVFICTAWFLLAIKPQFSRVAEYFFLNSLPVSAAQMRMRFLVQDLRTLVWIPVAFLGMFAGLYFAAPPAFLLRLYFLAVLLFINMIILNYIIHLFSAIRIFPFSRQFPAKYHPFILFTLLIAFALLFISFIANPQFASGFYFWTIFAFLGVCILIFFLVAGNLFRTYHSRACFFRNAKYVHSGVNRSTRQFPRPLMANPFIYKNMIKAFREKNAFAVILSSVFLSFAYLDIVNNPFENDKIAVLNVLTAIFAAMFAYNYTNQFSPLQESESILYALPIKRSDLYFGSILPAILWYSGFVILSGLMLFVSKVNPIAIFFFLAEAFLLSVIFLAAALNQVFGNYPDIKTGQRYYVYWILLFSIAAAVFYKYRFFVIPLLALTSLIPLRKFRLYKIQF